MYGKVGRAQLKTIYGRQYSTKNNDKLTHSLTAALRVLSQIIQNSPPRTISFDIICDAPDGHAVLYADAFFELGDLRLSPGDPDSIPVNWKPLEAPGYKNGWGAVVFLKHRHFAKMKDPPFLPDGSVPEAITFRGEVPADILQRFCSRRAFIYFLEAWAQCMAIWTVAHLIEEPFIAFCDNEAAKHALVKGYGKDEGINAVFSIYWQACCQQSCDPWIERVTSKDNPSDGVSRDDFEMAKSRKWHHYEIGTAEIWPILLRAIDDEQYAVAQAPGLITAALQSQLPIRRRLD